MIQVETKKIGEMIGIGHLREIWARRIESKPEAGLPEPALPKGVYNGLVRLIVTPVFQDGTLEKLDCLRTSLSQIEGVRLLMIGGNDEWENDVLEVIFVLNLERPMRLLNLLKSMPFVSKVKPAEEEILISIK